jgi:hypothetical protein
MKQNIYLYTLEKWKACKNRFCRLNISDSQRSLAYCNMCDGNPNKKTIVEILREKNRIDKFGKKKGLT